MNLLAGRAFKAELFPLTWREISDEVQIDLHRYLRFGGLPSAYLNAHSDEVCGWQFFRSQKEAFMAFGVLRFEAGDNLLEANYLE